MLEANPSHKFRNSAKSKSLNLLSNDFTDNESHEKILKKNKPSSAAIFTRADFEVKKKSSKRPKTVDSLSINMQSESIDNDANKPVLSDSALKQINKKSILKNPKEKSIIIDEEKLNETLTTANILKNIDTIHQSTNTIVLTSLSNSNSKTTSNNNNVANIATTTNIANSISKEPSSTKLSVIQTDDRNNPTLTSSTSITLPKVNEHLINNLNQSDDLILKNSLVSFKLNSNGEPEAQQPESYPPLNKLTRTLSSRKHTELKMSPFARIPKLKNSKVDIILMPINSYTSGNNQRPTVQNLSFSVNRNLEFDSKRFSEKYSRFNNTNQQLTQIIPQQQPQQIQLPPPVFNKTPAIDNRFYNLLNLVKPPYFNNEVKDIRNIIDKNDALKSINIDIETRDKMSKTKKHGSRLAMIARQVIASGEYSFT